jgi:hypothetical protein
LKHWDPDSSNNTFTAKAQRRRGNAKEKEKIRILDVGIVPVAHEAGPFSDVIAFLCVFFFASLRLCG